MALPPAQSEAKAVSSMVQPEQPLKVLDVVVDPQGRHSPEIKATTSVCPSPFKMKPIGLQERYEIFCIPLQVAFLFFKKKKNSHQLKMMEAEMIGLLGRIAHHQMDTRRESSLLSPQRIWL